MKKNKYDCCATHGELYAAAYKFVGEVGLRRVLEETKLDDNKESALKAAEELETVGLDHIAKIITEYAETLPSKADWKFCPYPDIPLYKLDRQQWQKLILKQIASQSH